MEKQELSVYKSPTTPSFTQRDIVMIAFRHRRVALACFFGIFLGATLYFVLWPKYEAETEILVRRERVDPVVTSQQTSPMVVSNVITEEELNSEVQVIRSQDVLRKVVMDCGLDQGHSSRLFGLRTAEERIASAVGRLRSNLLVEALPKTNIIRVSFISRDPKLAARVLNTLDSDYLEEHRELHRPVGQFAFFDQQTKKAKQELDATEAGLKAFPAETGIANPTLTRDITLQKLNDFNANLGQTRQAIAETQKRIDALEHLTRSTPPRLTTQVRVADDALVLQQMKTTLLNLELKRSEMISKYQPDYPPVQELDKEIAEARAAIAGEKPLNDATTDQNPAYVWIESELAKAQTDLRGYQAKAAETEAIVRQTLDSARRLDVKSIEQQDLLRAAKASEENYLLYLRKREEANITDALDRTDILNVGIAEKPTVPVFPAQSAWMFGLFAMVLALSVSSGMILTLEYLDTSFRTPAEVEGFLDLPVLAAFPDQNSNRYQLEHRNGSKAFSHENIGNSGVTENDKEENA
jgi:uncharacterized protein involved in exopolysaccharide biosynthesis